jgi:anti-sigma factor RsiW
MAILKRRNLVCQQVVELVTDYLEGAMPSSTRRRFESHLRGCPACTEYVAQIKATIALAGQTADLEVAVDELTPEQEEGFAALFRQWNNPQ